MALGTQHRQIRGWASTDLLSSDAALVAEYNGNLIRVLDNMIVREGITFLSVDNHAGASGLEFGSLRLGVFRNAKKGASAPLRGEHRSQETHLNQPVMMECLSCGTYGGMSHGTAKRADCRTTRPLADNAGMHERPAQTSRCLLGPNDGNPLSPFLTDADQGSRIRAPSEKQSDADLRRSRPSNPDASCYPKIL